MRLVPIVLAVTAVLAVFASSASASPASRCRTEGTTIAATAQIRVYAHGDHGLDLWTCAYASRTWRPISLGAHGSVKLGRGVTDIDVAGRYVGLRVLDSGCSRGECEGPLVQVYDPLRKRQSVDAKGDAYVLRRDGTFAVVTPKDAAGNASVELYDILRATPVVAATGAIDPGTLALAGRNVYWMQDGAPRTALLQDAVA